jgi:flavorubredoxin/flavin reductase (DIM6/NTAB) family NADH-FMN oxidoreductase RutF
VYLVKEGNVLNTGRHELTFLMAPMIHWPEVMMTYDKTEGILFSADAFGTFGALNGAIFADEVDFERDYMDEARRYYTNIVGKYGQQVQTFFRKVADTPIKMLCPLHGFVWRRDISTFFDKYAKWSAYEPEDTGVMIAYASVYGNTENAAEILSSRLRERGIRTVMYDVSVTPASEIVAASFRWSHLVFASTTYNAGIFVNMEDLLRDLASHNLQNRTVAFIENGSWAPTSGKLMAEIFSGLKNTVVLDAKVSIRSSLKESQLADIEALADAIDATLPHAPAPAEAAQVASGEIQSSAFRNLTYGLFILTAREGDKDNGCVINTLAQMTTKPNRVSICVNKDGCTHDMILRTGVFNVSILTQEAPFSLYQHFGFQSGRDVNKFEDPALGARSANGLMYLPEYTNAFVSAKVISAQDYGTHTLFIAEVTEAQALSKVPSVTYAYYHAHVKPRPSPAPEKKKGWVCNICGYIYEGDPLPADFICPLCKHPASDFSRL